MPELGRRNRLLSSTRRFSGYTLSSSMPLISSVKYTGSKTVKKTVDMSRGVYEQTPMFRGIVAPK